jgi:hypothetical protein
LSVKAKESLTVRPTSRAGAKAGLSDPTVPRGRAVAQRIKVTLGIIQLSPPLVIMGDKPRELTRIAKYLHIPFLPKLAPVPKVHGLMGRQKRER